MEPAVIGIVADLVRLFAEVIDGIELSFADLVVTVPEEGPRTLASGVSSRRLHTASLLASMRAMSQTPFPALEDLFARLGLPIDEPYDI